MVASGEIIPLPFSGVEHVSAAPRIVTLYPDRQHIWQHRSYRMPPPLRDLGTVYSSDAGLQQVETNGQLIDVYA